MNGKPKKVTITPVTIGPDNVDEHIDKCKSNRGKNRKHVNTWIRAIKKGNFRDGGLIFADEKGLYDDAQHRLAALKMTNYTALFYIVAGLDRTTLNMTVDSGKKRTNTDRLAAKNVRYANLICPSIEEIIDLSDPWRKSTSMLLPDEVLSFYDRNAKELDSLAQAYYGYEDIPPRYLIAFQFIFTKINSAKADQFFKGITHRQLLKKGEPLFAFYEMLGTQTVINSEKAQLKRYIRNGIIIAWNAHLKGDVMDSMEPTERYITLEGTAGILDPDFDAESNGGEGEGGEGADEEGADEEAEEVHA